MRKRILVINPNTSESVTEIVLRNCRLVSPGLEWQGATSRLGAAYISTEATYAIAEHAVLETYADHFDEHDAVLIGCFGDPGLLALREIATVPIIGLAQSSFNAAAVRGRFAVVTGGKAWETMLYRFARSHRFDTQLTGIHAIELTGAQIAEAPEMALDALAAAANDGVTGGAQLIVLGGAALGGLAQRLQARVAVPVLDNIALAAHAVQDIVVNAQPTLSQSGFPYALLGAGAALTRLMLRPCN